ncbi:MAG: membrane dipeptidase [Clostridia bacterium]|nr:membrane dipeptidase [Clostridia bacterium]
MIIFDTHCDTLDLLKDTDNMYTCDTHYNFSKAANYDTHIQITDIWVDNAEHKPISRVDGLIDRFYEETKNVSVIKTAADLEKAKGVCVMLGIEGGEGIGGSIKRLYDLFSRGVRLVTLTWNHENEISGTAFENGGGLKPFGREAVREMENLGIMVDVSHLSDKGFYDVLEMTKKPFIASHSNSRKVCDIFRNLTDDMFLSLIKKGGVTGINLCPDFLGENPDIDTIVKHIEHFMSLGGEDNVGIGADFDGVPALPDGIRGTEDLYKIFDRLSSLNYSQELCEKIAYKNMMRVFSEVLPEK